MIVIIGGTNIDIIGHAKKGFSYATSNIGNIVYTPGGVGSNIAHNLAKLNIPVTLFSAVGDDFYGRELIQKNSSFGIDMSHVLVKPNVSTGTYLAILDDKGELVCAIANTDILEYIDVGYLKSRLDIIKQASFLVCDTNIPKASIEYLVSLSKLYNIPILVEPVSCEKSKKVLDALDGIFMITPNFDELCVLNNNKDYIKNDENIVKLAQNLVKKGVQNVLVTCGPRGVCCVNKDGFIFENSIKTDVVNVTGAGDALISGVLYGLYKKLDLHHCIKYGIRAATITIQSSDTVSCNLNEANIEKIY